MARVVRGAATIVVLAAGLDVQNNCQIGYRHMSSYFSDIGDKPSCTACADSCCSRTGGVGYTWNDGYTASNQGKCYCITGSSHIASADHAWSGDCNAWWAANNTEEVEIEATDELATTAAEACPFTAKCMNSEGVCATCNKSPWYATDHKCTCGPAASDWMTEDQCTKCSTDELAMTAAEGDVLNSVMVEEDAHKKSSLKMDVTGNFYGDGSCGSGLCTAGSGYACKDCSSTPICHSYGPKSYDVHAHGSGATCGSGCRTPAGGSCYDCSNQKYCYVYKVSEANLTLV